MNLDNALSQNANPLLRIAEHHHIRYVQPYAHIGRADFVNEGTHFQRREQKFVPDIFYADMNADLTGVFPQFF